MKQIILTVEDNSLVPKLKAAVKMLQGVVSVKVINKEEKTKPNKETLEAIERRYAAANMPGNSTRPQKTHSSNP